MDDIVAHQLVEIELLRERVRQLEDALVPPSVRIPVEYRLTSTEAKIFAHLASRDEATKEGIMLAIYSDRIDEAPEIKIVDVLICKMRRKMAAFGVEIRTIWGRGYALDGRERFRLEWGA